MRKPNRAKLRKQADDFNARFPVGTPVRYWRGGREGEGAVGVTRSEAQVLSGHSPVVWIDGCTGCMHLSHVEPVDPRRAP